MDTHATSGRSRLLTRAAVASVLALSLALSGCSGGGDQGSGSSESSGGSTQKSQDAGQTTAAPEETTAAPEATSTVPAGEAIPQTTDRGGSTNSEAQGPSTALSGGLEEARERAKSWNEDAELYAIASVPATVNAEGENSGWLYSFVSESAGAVISVPYTNDRLRQAQGQQLPEGQIRRISGDTLSTGDLVDSSEAIQRSDDVKSYLENNPQTGASAGLDSGSGDEPEWILSIPSQALQDRVSATE
jgi:hypothetical protein